MKNCFGVVKFVKLCSGF